MEFGRKDKKKKPKTTKEIEDEKDIKKGIEKMKLAYSENRGAFSNSAKNENAARPNLPKTTEVVVASKEKQNNQEAVFETQGIKTIVRIGDYQAESFSFGTKRHPTDDKKFLMTKKDEYENMSSICDESQKVAEKPTTETETEHEKRYLDRCKWSKERIAAMKNGDRKKALEYALRDHIKIEEDINLEDQKGVEIMENFNKPTEKYPKRMSPPEEHLVMSKSSLKDIDIPKDNLPSMRLMHYSHILFSELSNFSDPNNFTYGNESNFKEKNKNVFTNQIPLDVYLEDVNEWATIKINPYILTLHKFARIILGKDKSIGGSKTTKLLSFLRSKEAKQKIELTFSDSTHGKVKAKFPLVTFNFLEDKKHIAVFFHPAFYLGVLNVDRRILQNVPSNIFEIIKDVYREKSGKKSVKHVTELILLNYFYRIIKVNNQNKDDHRMSISTFPFSKRTRAKEKHEIMTFALKTFSDARVNKLILGFKIKGNIIEFETKKFIGSCVKDTKKDGDNDSHKLIQ